MTIDDLMRLADRAYSRFHNDVQQWQLRAAIQAAIDEAVASERERCAKVASETVCDAHLPTGIRIYGTKAADAIRKGQTP